jgi:hypothetical protein
VAVILMERRAQMVSAPFQRVSVAFTYSLDEASRSLNVGEEQGDCSLWELTHAAPPNNDAQSMPDTPEPLVCLPQIGQSLF